MHDNDVDSIAELVLGLKTERDWASEINNLSLLIDRLHGLNKVTSVRELSRLLGRSKSWIGVSLILIRGFRVYPEIEKLSNRNKAYKYLQKKQKLRRLVES